MDSYLSGAYLASYLSGAHLASYLTGAHIASYFSGTHIASYLSGAQLASYLSRAHLASYLMCTADFFHGVKQPRREADLQLQLVPSSRKVHYSISLQEVVINQLRTGIINQ
jgi:hypothetical protein